MEISAEQLPHKATLFIPKGLTLQLSAEALVLAIPILVLKLCTSPKTNKHNAQQPSASPKDSTKAQISRPLRRINIASRHNSIGMWNKQKGMDLGGKNGWAVPWKSRKVGMFQAPEPTLIKWTNTLIWRLVWVVGMKISKM